MINKKLLFRRSILCLTATALSASLLLGCKDTDEKNNIGNPAQQSGSALSTLETELPADTARDNTPVVYTPSAPGIVVHERNNVSLDCSNMADGYVMLTYLGDNEKVKFQITTPDGTKYTYLVTKYGEATVFPLTGGDGSYTFAVLESVDLTQDLYAIAFSQNEEVVLADEFLPFLNPNVYASFASDSICVEKGSELAAKCESDLDVIESIYNYVTRHISYDSEKAQSVTYGYTPVPDETLASGSGICFDYAALMTSMLRSQRIPTKLEVGYAGEVYHAWISCYVYEIGWVDNIIQFDGEHWSLMDPTLAANNNSHAVQEYIGDGSKYIVKYTY